MCVESFVEYTKNMISTTWIVVGHDITLSKNFKRYGRLIQSDSDVCTSLLDSSIQKPEHVQRF